MTVGVTDYQKIHKPPPRAYFIIILCETTEVFNDMIPLSDNIKIYYDSEQDTLVISEKNDSPELYWNAGIGRCKSKYKTFYKTFSRKATKKYL